MGLLFILKTKSVNKYDIYFSFSFLCVVKCLWVTKDIYSNLAQQKKDLYSRVQNEQTEVKTELPLKMKLTETKMP